MHKQRGVETIVGIFMIIAAVCLIFLAIKVSGLSGPHGATYAVTANFQNIGDLRKRAAVTIAGVDIGEVTNIQLNPQTYQAVVTMRIDDGNKIPDDSTANIFTAGLIGSNYISLTPGFSEQYLKNGGVIQRTNQALILQDVIGQLLFTLKDDSAKSKSSDSNPAGATS